LRKERKEEEEEEEKKETRKKKKRRWKPNASKQHNPSNKFKGKQHRNEVMVINLEGHVKENQSYCS